MRYLHSISAELCFKCDGISRQSYLIHWFHSCFPLQLSTFPHLRPKMKVNNRGISLNVLSGMNMQICTFLGPSEVPTQEPWDPSPGIHTSCKSLGESSYT